VESRGRQGQDVSARLVPAILLHGALRSRLGLLPTAAYLRRRGVDARPFGYTTRRGSLLDHARALDRFVLASFDRAPPVLGFVTHSMGALVVRAWLGLLDAGGRGPSQRIVMLSPPNHGSKLAEHHRGRGVVRLLYGDAARELQPARVAELPALPPSAHVLVLAGGRGDPRGWNPLLEGDDDGVVAVGEMGLPGVEPQVVGGVHALLQWRPRVLDRAAVFLREER
jgi:hypothetical protein